MHPAPYFCPSPSIHVRLSVCRVRDNRRRIQCFIATSAKRPFKGAIEIRHTLQDEHPQAEQSPPHEVHEEQAQGSIVILKRSVRWFLDGCRVFGAKLLDLRNVKVD